MRSTNQAGWIVSGLFFVFALTFSCAPLPFLKVNYRLPSGGDDWKGKKVFLTLQDARSQREIIGAGAKSEFKNYSGEISFSLARGTEPGFKIGVYDVPSLVKQAFKSRLEAGGIKLVLEKGDAEIQLEISLNDFFLDLVDRKWKARMGYEARLIKEGNVLAKQMISGEAERLKVIGRGQADEVLGEIFTDTMNKLDLAKLFQQAGL
ncbi:MAG: hypothetical protein MUO52_16005 [Desulfobacterales bacterium]|nr:hypothetical protein [Desulfobacterales bacterium]